MYSYSRYASIIEHESLRFSPKLSHNLLSLGHGADLGRCRLVLNESVECVVLLVVLGDHLSLDNLSAAFVPALTSDSGTSFTPSSDQHDLLELPLPPYPHSHSQSKSSSLPSSDRDDSSDRAHRSHRSATTGGTQGTYNNTSTTTTVAASPCDFFKTLDRWLTIAHFSLLLELWLQHFF